MAYKIQAIQKYSPRLKLGQIVAADQLEPYIAGRTKFSREEVHNVLNELAEAVVFFARDGRAVKIDGLGVFGPTISIEGRISLSHRIDSELKKKLNDAGKFKGEIVNREMIGKTVYDMVAFWNEAYPEDRVSL